MQCNGSSWIPACQCFWVTKLCGRHSAMLVVVSQNEFVDYITCLKDAHEKERYLDLGNMEIKNVLSKLRLSSFKLAIVTGKWFKTKKEERICKFCDLNEVE